MALAIPGRISQLDVLRAIAIFLVLGRHMYPDPVAFPSALRGLLSAWQNGGWIGVDLFFVLSGFLVSGLLFREFQKTGSLDILRFLVRRGLKIYPAFYLFLAVSLVWFSLLRRPKSVSQGLGELFFLQNYVGSIWTHTWSLAVEEHFYILLALLSSILAVRARSFRMIPAIFLCVAVLTLMARIITSAALPFAYTTNIFPTHLRFDSLFAGVAMSYFFHFKREALYRILITWRWPIWLLSGAVLVPVFVFEGSVRNVVVYTVGFTLIELVFALNLPLFLLVAEPRFAALKMVWRALAVVGKHSYSIYLYHIMLMGISGSILIRVVPGWPRVSDSLTQGQACLMLVSYVAMAIGGGILGGMIVEVPVLRLRDRLWPSRSTSQ